LSGKKPSDCMNFKLRFMQLGGFFILYEYIHRFVQFGVFYFIEPTEPTKEIRWKEMTEKGYYGN
jgi:hypothetical protein